MVTALAAQAATASWRPRFRATTAAPKLTMTSVLDSFARSSVTQTPARGKPLHILIVDDEATILDMEAKILECDGHRVETAENGEAAWQALQGGDYDLLVTDNLMPGVSGLALVRQLRIASITLPIVMVSGTLGNLDTAKLTRDPWSRIHGFVSKPFTIPQLVLAVHRALDSGADGNVSQQLAPA
jgi:CheY-like chemotaxis protein